MIDRITLLIELVGFVILLLWIVIPIREFRGILRVVRGKHRAAPYEPGAQLSDPARHPAPAPPWKAGPGE